MKKLFLAGALLVWQPVSLAADSQDAPLSTAFKPWQRMWQCNDVRVPRLSINPALSVMISAA